jgi:hypothetical protein
MNNPPSFFQRFGCFVLLMGGLILVLGIAAAFSSQPSFGLILFGLLLSLIGSGLWRGKRPPSEGNSRINRARRRRRGQEHYQDESDSIYE